MPASFPQKSAPISPTQQTETRARQHTRFALSQSLACPVPRLKFAIQSHSVCRQQHSAEGIQRQSPPKAIFSPSSYRSPLQQHSSRCRPKRLSAPRSSLLRPRSRTGTYPPPQEGIRSNCSSSMSISSDISISISISIGWQRQQ